MDKYQYLTGNDLGYKPGVVKQTNFEYSQSGKVFNKGLDEKDKKRSTFKKVKKCWRQKWRVVKNDWKQTEQTNRHKVSDWCLW